MKPLNTHLIRAKKLGVLIRDARLSAGRSIPDCAAAMGVGVEIYEAFELGDQSPSLPELEFLAYYLDIPLEHFWGQETLSARLEKNRVDIQKLTIARQRVIGVLLRKARLEAKKTLEDVAQAAGLAVDDMEAYEYGELPVPIPVLEQLAGLLNRDLREFQDRKGPVGVWFIQQRALHEFKDLPPELQEFVSRPINRPYLELAQRLSEMSVDKLRGVAEGLLEITL